MTILAGHRLGRVLLHLLAMLGDRSVRFHVAGITRELRWISTASTLLTEIRARLVGALVSYLAKPFNSMSSAANADGQSLAAMLHRGDVLLSDGNTRVAALVRRLTRSSWSHVSMYVGPLEEGPDPLCIVEADIAAGVRSIRLSELNALHVRVLRPVGLNEMRRRQLADWVVGRIGSEYDLAHAWNIARSRMGLPLPKRWQSAPNAMAGSATRFICCSLLVHAFTLVGYSILPDQLRIDSISAGHSANLTPGDFERAAIFEVVGPNGA